MNQPAHAWQPAPDVPEAPAGPPLTMAPPAPLPLAAPPAPGVVDGAPAASAPPAPAAPAGPPAPAAPIAPAAPSAPAGFSLPTDSAAALDLTVPLAPVAPPAQSLAMPEYEPVQAMPDHLQVVEGPAPLGGVAAASAEDLAALRELRPEPSTEGAPAASTGADADGQLWLPGNFLVLGLLGLTWQLLAVYGGFVLPIRSASGATLDNFDSVVTTLPLMSSWPESCYVGIALGLVALGLIWAGWKRGVREPVLQVAGALLAASPVLLFALVPALFPTA